MSFCKGFVRKSLCLICASPVFAGVTPLTQLRLHLHRCRPLDDEVPLPLAIRVETLVNMFCPLPLSPCETVCLQKVRGAHLAGGGRAFTGDQLMQPLTRWPHACIPSPGKATPHVVPRLRAAATGPFFWNHYLLGKWGMGSSDPTEISE